MPPALVFIIPACNAAATLGDTVRSVLGQERADVAALVIDDGSTDATAAVGLRLASADPRVRVVRQENRGLSGARNRGVAELLAALYCGPVCFLDADDTVEPRYAEVMLEALGDADAAACACRMVGPALEDVGWTIRPGDHDLTPERMIEYNPLAVGAVTVHLSSLARLGLLAGADAPFDRSLPVHEDWDLWLRLTSAGARWAPVVPDGLFCYRMQAGSMSAALERMHRVGLDVIARAPVRGELKPAAARRWTVRHLARAAAAGDEPLAHALLRQLPGTWDEPELELLAGSLRWALCQHHQTGPARVTPVQERAWRERVGRILAGVQGIEGVLSRLAFSGMRWSVAARALLEKVNAGRTGVVYGVGRNGRELLAAIERALIEELDEAGAAGSMRSHVPRIAWIDDNPAAETPTLLGRPLPRLRTEQLTERHAVLVTPEERGRIVAELRARGLAIDDCTPVRVA